MSIFSRIKDNIKYKLLKQFKPEIIGFTRNFQGKKVKYLRVSNTAHISNRKNVTLSSGVFIAHFTYIDGYKSIEIGEGTGIASFSSILTHSGHNTIRLYGQNYAELYGQNMKGHNSAPVKIGSYTFIGPNSVIMPGSIIGKGCIVTAYTFVNGTFDDYSIIRGNPGRVVGDTRKIDDAFLRKYPEFHDSYYLNTIESTESQKNSEPDKPQNWVRKIIFRCGSILFNNIFINHLLILMKMDDFPKSFLNQNNWARRKYQQDKTLQENVGCSHVSYIQNLVDIGHMAFKNFVAANIKPGSSVLDIGSGTGLFLKDLEDSNLNLHGIDLNAAFLEKAKQLVPNATYYLGSFLDKFEGDKKFDLLSCFSVMMYIEPSRIEEFFDKMYNMLNKDGFVFIQYIHALSYRDLFYPDITYIKYSPERIEKIVSKKFSIIKHEHFYHSHKVGKYDLKRNYFPDGQENRLDSIENSYLLILQKK